MFRAVSFCRWLATDAGVISVGLLVGLATGLVIAPTVLPMSGLEGAHSKGVTVVIAGNTGLFTAGAAMAVKLLFGRIVHRLGIVPAVAPAQP